MNDQIHRHLDGDAPAAALSNHEQAQAEAWERIVASFQRAAPRSGMPPWLEDRIMAEVHAVPERRGLRRFATWWVSPLPLRLSPLSATLVAAALVGLVLTDWPGPSPSPAGDPAGNEEPIVYVQFLLEAPGATSVAVAGDFTAWEPTFPLEDLDGDGVWSARVPVGPGVHAYMFLIDGTRWLTDPNAERYQEDGFGNRNAIVAVGVSS